MDIITKKRQFTVLKSVNCRFATPHFHAWYGDYKVIVNIKDGLVKGEMPGRALRMILEWLDLHREELMENWELAQTGAVLRKIEPLK